MSRNHPTERHELRSIAARIASGLITLGVIAAPMASSYQLGEVVIPFTDGTEAGRIYIDPVTGEEYYNHPLLMVRINLNPPAVPPPPVPPIAPPMNPDDLTCDGVPFHTSVGGNADAGGDDDQTQSDHVDDAARMKSDATDRSHCYSGDEGATPNKAVIKTETIRKGHWTGVVDWYKINSDENPNKRYYITNTQWYGLGTSGDPAEHDIHHITHDVYHEANGWSTDGDTFFRNFDPLDEDPEDGTFTFNVGWGGPSVSYSWQQDGLAYLRYDLQDFENQYRDSQLYTNRASFFAGSPGHPGSDQTKDRIEWAAAGVVAAGQTGYAFARMYDHSSACRHSWPSYICDHYYDDTDWMYASIDWP